ncbi:hypothetical protein D3C72_2468590 [compost metagenome]
MLCEALARIHVEADVLAGGGVLKRKGFRPRQRCAHQLGARLDVAETIGLCRGGADAKSDGDDASESQSEHERNS